MTELRPCPKCGGEADLHEVCFAPWANAAVICSECGWMTGAARFEPMYSQDLQALCEEQAIKAWNDGGCGEYSRYIRYLL